jgi:hypothetical protein
MLKAPISDQEMIAALSGMSKSQKDTIEKLTLELRQLKKSASQRRGGERTALETKLLATVKELSDKLDTLHKKYNEQKAVLTKMMEAAKTLRAQNSNLVGLSAINLSMMSRRETGASFIGARRSGGGMSMLAEDASAIYEMDTNAVVHMDLDAWTLSAAGTKAGATPYFNLEFSPTLHCQDDDRIQHLLCLKLMLEHADYPAYFQQPPFTLEGGKIKIGRAEAKEINAYLHDLLETSLSELVTTFDLQSTDLRAITLAKAQPRVYQMPGKLHLLENAVRGCGEDTHVQWAQFLERLSTHLQTANDAVSASSLVGGMAALSLRAKGGGEAAHQAPAPRR